MGDLEPIEAALLRGLAEGEPLNRLARRFGMTTGAAAQTMYRLRKRVGADSPAHLIAVAFRKGWVT